MDPDQINQNTSEAAQNPKDTTQNHLHIPVLCKEVIESLSPTFRENHNNLFFDGTLGGGGYLLELRSKLREQNIDYTLVGSDLDLNALNEFEKILEDQKIDAELGKTIVLKQGNFAKRIKDFEEKSMQGIMLDLGFSSIQLDSSQRGFSYLKDNEILDLRYDPHPGSEPLWVKLRQIRDHAKLTKIIYNSSGEKLSPKFAQNILEAKSQGEIRTVRDLTTIILNSIPEKLKKGKYSILSRVWQSFRIWVNNEFENLDLFLPVAISKLAPGGRLCIVSFHSLEDKIVANYFRKAAKPVVIDDYGNKEFYYKHITGKAILPSIEEVEFNPRSRSGILRVLERCDN